MWFARTTIALTTPQITCNMKKILVAIDFSENADNAISFAKRIALKTGARLAFLHIYEPYATDISLLVAAGKSIPSGQMEAVTRQNLERYVHDAQKEGYLAEALWETGKVAESILKKAAETSADLIVTGRTGKGGLLDKLMGSKGTKIALDAECPVLVVPPHAPLADFKQLLYATQLEYEETDILQEVKSLAEALAARLTLIKITSLEQPNIQPDGQFIEEITQKLAIAKDNIIIHKGGGVLDGIEQYAHQLNADMVVISRRERSFFEEFIVNPSITKQLVVQTTVPLLIYHLNK